MVAFSAQPGHAQGSLFYLEAQAVGGYSSAAREAIYYSMMPLDAMQKPGVGFDWLARLSGEGGDFGVVGVQARLAYNHEPDREVQLQLYNAWFKYKAGFADLWIGHDRPALGLSSYFDTHGLLLPTLAMMGWGFDRDWGAGFYRDFPWGNLAGSLTDGLRNAPVLQGELLRLGEDLEGRPRAGQLQSRPLRGLGGHPRDDGLRADVGRAGARSAWPRSISHTSGRATRAASSSRRPSGRTIRPGPSSGGAP